MNLTHRERSELAYLERKPGLWGGVIENGQIEQDADLSRWMKAGLVEVRHNESTKKPGFYITDAGRAALGRVGAGMVPLNTAGLSDQQLVSLIDRLHAELTQRERVRRDAFNRAKRASAGRAALAQTEER